MTPARTIALVHYTAPPVVGGVERVIGRHARLMADAGYEVRIVAGRGAPAGPGVAFVHLPLADSHDPRILRINGELEAGRVPPEFAEVAGILAAGLREALRGADVVIAHNVASLNLNLAFTAALREAVASGGPGSLVLWHHDLAWTKPRFRPALHEGEPWSLIRTAWPGAIQVTISEPRRDELAELLGIPRGEIAVVPGGVDLALPSEAPALAELYPLLLVPVRITPRKNIELALRVLAEMRRRGRSAGLVVSGPVDPHDSTDRAYLRQLVALREDLGVRDSAFFFAESEAGPPGDAEFQSWYEASDVLLLPSWDEGFGLPILEAGAIRLPIVCSDLPAIRELAGDAADYFAPGADPSDVADVIVRRVDSEPRMTLSHRIRLEYSWGSVYRRCIEPLLRRCELASRP
jgi:glycosyltransferase involved in cell wall biosynthesis